MGGDPVLRVAWQTQSENVGLVEPAFLKPAVATLAQGGQAFGPGTHAASGATLGRCEISEEVPDQLSVHVLVVRLVPIVEQALVACPAASVGRAVLERVGVVVADRERSPREGGQHPRIFDESAKHADAAFRYPMTEAHSSRRIFAPFAVESLFISLIIDHFFCRLIKLCA